MLVVCTGNICRSPIGEVMLRDRLLAAGADAEVASAGTGAVVGAGAHEHTIEVLEERGLSAREHVARQFDASDSRFELILVMEGGHKRWIERHYPQLAGRTYLLGHWLEEEIADPIGRPLDTFRISLGHIERAVDSWLPRLGLSAGG
jgi:protein-tyrosine phosphatase